MCLHIFVTKQRRQCKYWNFAHILSHYRYIIIGIINDIIHNFLVGGYNHNMYLPTAMELFSEKNRIEFPFFQQMPGRLEISQRIK